MPSLFFVFLEENYSLFWRLSWHNTNKAFHGPMICTALYCIRFDAGISNTRASGRGLGPGNLIFFGPCEMVSSR